MTIVYRPQAISTTPPTGGCSACQKKRAMNGINSTMPESLSYVLPSNMKQVIFRKNTPVDVGETDFNYLLKIRRHGHQIFYEA